MTLIEQTLAIPKVQGTSSCAGYLTNVYVPPFVPYKYKALPWGRGLGRTSIYLLGKSNDVATQSLIPRVEAPNTHLKNLDPQSQSLSPGSSFNPNSTLRPKT